MNIVLIGMPGCGKTTLGNILAQRLGIPFFDSDKVLIDTYGESIEEMFHKGEAYFRQKETKIIEILSKKDRCVISTGGGVVLNYNNILNLKKNGVIIFINRNIEDISNTLSLEGRPIIKDKNKLYELYEQRINLYKNYCDYEVENYNLEETIDKILEICKTYI
ncbi:shikimate kinase [Caloramator proteoclasticus]|uniref:Shikimate kinase n=1 Tax=Caloramator proteoclasticus DSM 10124 TaxID=1121262 RepID=A0A1M4Y922_9CLOT|nr:shikimate kinase [Caloramator proteoclasticus]SHF02327.1 shikimate kinase [Caloramator proteoclasticus DSM 10124]